MWVSKKRWEGLVADLQEARSDLWELSDRYMHSEQAKEALAERLAIQKGLNRELRRITPARDEHGRFVPRTRARVR
jgi:hypothetical protein